MNGGHWRIAVEAGSNAVGGRIGSMPKMTDLLFFVDRFNADNMDIDCLSLLLNMVSERCITSSWVCLSFSFFFGHNFDFIYCIYIVKLRR